MVEHVPNCKITFRVLQIPNYSKLLRLLHSSGPLLANRTKSLFRHHSQSRDHFEPILAPKSMELETLTEPLLRPRVHRVASFFTKIPAAAFSFSQWNRLIHLPVPGVSFALVPACIPARPMRLQGQTLIRNLWSSNPSHPSLHNPKLWKFSVSKASIWERISDSLCLRFRLRLGGLRIISHPIIQSFDSLPPRPRHRGMAANLFGKITRLRSWIPIPTSHAGRYGKMEWRIVPVILNCCGCKKQLTGYQSEQTTHAASSSWNYQLALQAHKPPLALALASHSKSWDKKGMKEQVYDHWHAHLLFYSLQAEWH